MYQQRRPDRHPQTADERVLEVYDSSWFEERTRYERTMSRLESVFGRDGVFYALYERLFEEPTVRDLAAFLGMQPCPAHAERHLNVSAKSEILRLPDDTARRVAEYYRATYDAVAARVGRDQLAAAWPDQQWLDPR